MIKHCQKTCIMAYLTQSNWMQYQQQRFYVYGRMIHEFGSLNFDDSSSVTFGIGRTSQKHFTSVVTDIPYSICPKSAITIQVTIAKDVLGLDTSDDDEMPVSLGMYASKMDSDEYGLSLIRAFLKGAFHAQGSLQYDVDHNWTCVISLGSSDDAAVFLKQIQKHLPIPSHSVDTSTGTIEFIGTNAIDLVGWISGDTDPDYVKWANRYQGPLSGYHPCMIERACPEAILPRKAHASDVGYDLTLLRVHKRFTSTCTLYDTGVRICSMPPGMYAEIVPRSSLSKSGYMIANSIGIIDPSYKDNLYVALVKVDPDAPSLSLPFRGAQLIFRPQIHVAIHDIVDQDSPKTMLTARGTGGFGSTGGSTSVALA